MAPPRSHANGMRSDRQPEATPFHERDRGFESRLSGRPGPDSAEARNIAPMLWSPPSPSSPAAPSTARDIAELCLPYRRDAKLGHDAVTAVGAAPVAPCARGEDVTRGGPAARDTAPVRSRGPRDHLCVSPRNRQDRDRPRVYGRPAPMVPAQRLLSSSSGDKGWHWPLVGPASRRSSSLVVGVSALVPLATKARATPEAGAAHIGRAPVARAMNPLSRRRCVSWLGARSEQVGLVAV